MVPSTLGNTNINIRRKLVENYTEIGVLLSCTLIRYNPKKTHTKNKTTRHSPPPHPRALLSQKTTPQPPLKNNKNKNKPKQEREMFYLTTHSTHFIYGYMASDIWLRTILIVRKETRCRHIGYSYRLTARVLLYAPSHRQDNTYHGLCYTSRGALAGTRNSSMGPPHEGSIRRPIAP